MRCGLGGATDPQVVGSGDRVVGNVGDRVGRAVTRIVGDARGLGLMIGIELVGDQGTKEKAAARSANRVRARA